MNEQTKNIYQRINAVMKEVKYVQKDAQIQGYKAVTHDQVVSVARQAFVDNGIVMSLSQLEGKFDEPLNGAKMRLYTGKYKLCFVNMDNPSEYIPIEIEAQALDNGDKASGKCATYATKTAILKLLWLETGENDESRADARDTSMINEETAANLEQLMTEVGEGGNTVWSKKGQRLLAKYKIGHPQQLKETKLEAFKKDLGA